MKLDLKALVVLVLVVVISIWTVNLVRSRSYSGDNLSFAVGSGMVTITNPSDDVVAAQTSGTGSRTYNFTSNIEGVAGRSTREGSGRTAMQVFTFDLPAGSSEFSIENGTDVTFTADTNSQLTATVMPLSASTTRNTIIALLVAIAGSLYYISSTMNHSWIGMLRGGTPVQPVPVGTSDSGHGTPIKSFGDNISRKSD